MDKKTLAKQLDGIKHPVHENLSRSIIESAAAHGLVIVYGASDDLMELEGAIHDEFGCFGGGIALVDKQGLLSRLDAEFDEEPESEEISLRKKAAREIEPRWCKEPGIRWTYRTTIPHATFHVMRDGEVECRGIVFALSELDGVAAPFGGDTTTPAAPLSTGSPSLEPVEELGEWKVESSTVYRLMPAGYRRGQMTFKNAIHATVYADHQSGISAVETAKRIAVCLSACEGIPTERLEGKSIDEFVADEAFLTGMSPHPEGGAELGIRGLACQMLAASFAGQFKGTKAKNFLEFCMSHRETGPFIVTMQRVYGKTPATLRNEAMMQRDQAIAAAEFFKGLIENLSQAERERVGLYSIPGWNEHERTLQEMKASKA